MTVRAHCDDCGDVMLLLSDLTIRLCVDTGAGTYVFRCPKCLAPVVRPIHPSLKELLLTSGAKVEPWFLPEELFERHDGPPISVDDCIDFHLALNGAKQ